MLDESKGHLSRAWLLVGLRKIAGLAAATGIFWRLWLFACPCHATIPLSLSFIALALLAANSSLDGRWSVTIVEIIYGELQHYKK
ncbi:hypothetical protein ACO0LF_18080 [Undibacterium sp. Di27W]|uniref:hypothetical protein n=1 Tax=Undibacterium sp. Di27W TaxID=3413036 RepID=UPI003BF2A8C5